MGLKRCWTSDGTSAREIDVARVFSAFLNRYLIDVSGGESSPNGNPRRVRPSLFGPVAAELVASLRRYQCKQNGAVGSPQCTYWNQPDRDAAWEMTCQACQRPLVPWETFSQTLQHSQQLRARRNPLDDRVLRAWRAGDPADIAFVEHLLRTARRSGLIDAQIEHDELEAIRLQSKAVRSIQHVRRRLRMTHGKRGPGSRSLWDALVAERQAASFTWRGISASPQLRVLSSADLQHMQENPEQIGLDGSLFPGEDPRQEFIGIRFYAGAWSEDRIFRFATIVSLDPPDLDEAASPDIDEQVIVQLILYPGRNLFEQRIEALRYLKFEG